MQQRIKTSTTMYKDPPPPIVIHSKQAPQITRPFLRKIHQKAHHTTHTARPYRCITLLLML
jgi:hypothetical protein